MISLLLFVPFFLYLLSRNFYFSLSLLKEQFIFGLPLLSYAIIYMGFFYVDRLFITNILGLESLGIYALLWRFGILFQFFSIALIDAWPIVVFNADKEKNRQMLLTKLNTYYIATLITLGLSTTIASQCLIKIMIPIKYLFLTEYLPLFFLSLVLLDIARLLQTSFNLTNKTFYIPILAIVTLCIQYCTFFICQFFTTLNLSIVLLINIFTFSSYIVLSYMLTKKLSNKTIDDKRTITMACFLFVYIILFHILFKYHASLSYSFLMLFSWPLLLWFSNIISSDEKTWLLKIISTKFQYLFVAYNQKENPVTEYELHTYSNNLINKKIAIFGPYPPPFGGISVHIKRVTHKLLNQGNEVKNFDTTIRPRFRVSYIFQIIRFLITFKPSIIFYHTPYTKNGLEEFATIVFIKLLFGSKLILIEHDSRYLDKQSFLFKIIFNKLIKMINQQIFIGKSPLESYFNNKIFIHSQSVIEPAFLPPDLSQEQNILKSYPKELFHFLEHRSPILTANAFQLIFLDDKDLYGFDWCIELVSQLKPKFPDIGFVFALAQIGNKTYYDQLVKKIENLNIKNNFYILTNQKEYWPLLKKVDIFVRPTLADNFGISVAEALYFGKISIASNVCTRPKNTVLFKWGNKEDFFEKVNACLNNHIHTNISEQMHL